MRRLASFAATANPMELLTNPTGSRRYVCVQVTGIIDVSAPIEYEQLYAQALHAIRSGERYWLNSEEERALTQSNSGFQDEPLEMQYLFSYFRLPEEGRRKSGLLRWSFWISYRSVQTKIQQYFCPFRKDVECFGYTEDTYEDGELLLFDDEMIITEGEWFVYIRSPFLYNHSPG